MTQHLDTFGSHGTLAVGGRTVHVHRLDALARRGVGDVSTLPFSMKVLLEALLRTEDGVAVTAADIEAVAKWDPARRTDQEIAFLPARVILQDFTGVPCVVDLAAMRQQFQRMGGDPSRINPLCPVDLVIDHSVQVDSFGSGAAFADNVRLEMERNRERYEFLRWGQKAFRDFRAVPPGTGIVHQVNLEYLAPVVFVRKSSSGKEHAYPDSVLGTDSHTTMINGLGVLGWGVGGIEAEAAMLGQPVSMLLPEVVGFELVGRLPEGATATDAVLTVTQLLRRKGVVGKFVEFFGDGLDALSLPDRATIANMAPEYGATMGFFPVDDETISFLRFSGRDAAQVALVEAYCKEQGLFRRAGAPPPRFTDTLKLDLSTVEPSLAGPKRPQDRVPLADSKATWRKALPAFVGPAADESALSRKVAVQDGSRAYEVGHGSVVIAAITSCTNTSNPGVMMAAGVLAKKAVARGLAAKPWVKTSLAPGSQVVMEYLKAAGCVPALEALGFHLVGYGCTTCIGNSGPLPPPVSQAVKDGQLVVAAVLSGNRNFEGRVNAQVKANYLASPPLVVAYALAGTVDFDPATDPLGTGTDGKPVFLRDVWPTQEEVRDALATGLSSDMFRKVYANVFEGSPEWRALRVPEGEVFAWDEKSTYVRHAPFFESVSGPPAPVGDLVGARVLASLGDSITTDHISPAGNIAVDSPAGRYLQAQGVAPKDFNQYGARRGNHEVMVRGTFANIRLRNLLAPGTEGGVTRHLPSGETLSIFDASERYRAEGVPLVVLAGKEYGSGSSRDWAAKGPYLLGVRAVIAESYERIHRSNLVGMGVLPCELLPGESRESLGLTGEEVFAIEGLAAGLEPRQRLRVRARGPSGERSFEVTSRIDTPQEVLYYRNGGILQYVLRQLAAKQA